MVTLRSPSDRVCNALEHGLTGDGVTNDQPALAQLVDALGAAHAADGVGRVIYCPPGVYSVRDAGTVWRSGVSLIGAGAGATRFALSNPGDRCNPAPLAFFTTDQHGASRENHVADCTFAAFEIDGLGVEMEQYDVLAKGLGLQYVLRGRFHDLYIHDTAATGLGCDFLQDTVVRDVVTVRCGRKDNGNQMGGAGIGIGIGGWGAVERLTITACTTRDSGTNGIFLELQKDDWRPPRGIRITACHAEGNRFGISDWGADGLVVSACTMLGNLEAGFDVSSLGTTSVAGRGGLVTGCVIDGNVGHGVFIGDTPGRYTVRGNRISNNGLHGCRLHDLADDDRETVEMVIEGNEVWGNALDGIRLDAPTTDASIVANRIRNNGARSAPRARGAGATVSYTETRLVDDAAQWPPDGHRGKHLHVGAERPLVAANTATAVTLAMRRGGPSAWRGGDPPPAGTPYELPEAPVIRAGITVDAAAMRPTIRGNRIWDNQDAKTQTHALWITDTGACVAARVEDNDIAGNAVGAYRFDTPPRGGHWDFDY